MTMKYTNTVTIYDAFDGVMSLSEALEQLAEAVPQVHPTAKYQAQYDREGQTTQEELEERI